ncbi:MAG: hypothetical protein BBJ57_02520 [Desulfobacterales bacterium PC51MH44]|nr:MAG: hypothetical protein BBJ57_02520 [Desulfobacterales bacterium PC51MH44]
MKDEGLQPATSNKSTNEIVLKRGDKNMVKLSSYVFLFALSVMFVLPLMSNADERKANQDLQADQKDRQGEETLKDGKITSDKWISNGSELGPWWLKSSKKYDPIPLPLLYHLEGDYSFTQLDGNVDAAYNKGRVNLILRKNIFTNQIEYGICKNETTIPSAAGDITTRVEEQNLMESISIDFFDYMSFMAGIEWKRDDLKYVENRYTYYGGPFFYIIDTPEYNLSAGAFYGYEENEYMNDELKKLNPLANVPDYNSDGIRFMQYFTWFITKDIMFRESADYMHYLKKEDGNDLYRWKLSFGLNVGITENISVFSSYITEHSLSLAAINFGAEEKDTKLSVGIRFSL